MDEVSEYHVVHNKDHYCQLVKPRESKSPHLQCILSLSQQLLEIYESQHGPIMRTSTIGIYSLHLPRPSSQDGKASVIVGLPNGSPESVSECVRGVPSVGCPLGQRVCQSAF